MGGKRPDQHNIDPAEGSSTNHQWRGEGRSGDEHVETEQQQKFMSNPKDDQPMIPKEQTNPAARELQERKAAGKRDESRPQTDDERIDEASLESFPASDPPAQP
jgi:hypothetical protein